MELCVDWLKHLFITKFNRLSHTIYREFSSVLRIDICRRRQLGLLNATSLVDHAHSLGHRLGFAPLPLACVVRILVLSDNPDFSSVVVWIVH